MDKNESIRLAQSAYSKNSASQARESDDLGNVQLKMKLEAVGKIITFSTSFAVFGYWLWVTVAGMFG